VHKNTGDGTGEELLMIIDRRNSESPSNTIHQGTDKEFATLAGGCFWCLEAVFAELKGVENVVSGYSGGEVVNPSYHDVCTGNTGHAEAVQITYDPNVLSFGELLDVFFAVHDPTTLNRQGPDVGTQYRSAVFYHDEKQKQTAESKIKGLGKAGIWDTPIVTEVAPFRSFYPADDYHQGYFWRNREEAYCQVVINPKLAKLRKLHLNKLKKQDDAS
jgi:peptide-methionine (S)-S-oxide reductase